MTTTRTRPSNLKYATFEATGPDIADVCVMIIAPMVLLGTVSAAREPLFDNVALRTTIIAAAWLVFTIAVIWRIAAAASSIKANERARASYNHEVSRLIEDEYGFRPSYEQVQSIANGNPETVQHGGAQFVIHLVRDAGGYAQFYRPGFESRPV